MHPVEYIREMTRQPMWLLDSDRLILPSPPNAFVIQRYSDGVTCNIKFPNNIRYSSAIPGIIVTPESVHVTPNITVWLEPMVTPYKNIHVRSADSADHVEPHELELSQYPREYEKDITLPNDSVTYDIYGVKDSSKLKPRCLDLPMQLDTSVTNSSSFAEDRPYIGWHGTTRRFDKSAVDNDAGEANPYVYLSKRSGDNALRDVAAKAEDVIHKGVSALGDMLSEGMDVVGKGINVLGETTKPIAEVITAVLPDEATRMEVDDAASATAPPNAAKQDAKPLLDEAAALSGIPSDDVMLILRIGAQMQDDDAAKSRKIAQTMADNAVDTPPASPLIKDRFFNEE